MSHRAAVQDITTPQPYLRVFPEAAEVFAAPAGRYALHLFPLVSIDLAALDPAWQGWIHLVNPVEPAEGFVGEATAAHHKGWLRENWLAFHLNAAGRYELLGDMRYFYLENSADELAERYPGERQALQTHYAQQHLAYTQAKARYTQHGILYSANRFDDPNRDFSKDEPCNLLDQLGGGAEYGNWASHTHNPELDLQDPANVRPLMPDGTPFHFIASATGWEYCASGADAILLFFEPKSRTVLITFDWS